MRFAALIFFFALYCGLLVTGCSDGVSRRVAAIVFSVNGPVVFETGEQKDFRPVMPESRIDGGSLVRTFDGARLSIALLPAALVQVSSNSEIKIEELKISKDGNETSDAMRNRVARIRLNQGKITVLFSPRGERAPEFSINSGKATITADSDCLFRVQSDDTTTRVTCVQGKVYASIGAQPPIAIVAGYFQQWPPTRGEPIAAADDGTAQIDIMDSLEIGNQLRGLRSDWQNRHPF